MLAPVIAIDGPAAAGKGTVARLLAEMLHFHYLDSGKIYRAAAVAALARGLSPDDETAMGELAARLAADGISSDAGTERPEAGAAASRLARIPAVRAALLPLQRRMRRPPGLVADGRDMGTVVFADAELKIFLTADLQIRAERRRRQLRQKGIRATMASVLDDLRQRDRQDRVRAGSPLVAAADARAADSSRRPAEEIARELAAQFTAARGVHFQQ
ncbi:MAG: (d)CMP kinase [Gammaproteobacteria bacterium]